MGKHNVSSLAMRSSNLEELLMDLDLGLRGLFHEDCVSHPLLSNILSSIPCVLVDKLSSIQVALSASRS